MDIARRRIRDEIVNSLAPSQEQPEISDPMATHPTQYAHPESLVETDRLEKHLKDEGIRIVESNEDILLYDTGHIRAALQPARHHTRYHLHFLRRQGELVGLLRAVGVPVVWSRESENSQRWPRQMEGRKSADDTRSSEIS